MDCHTGFLLAVSPAAGATNFAVLCRLALNLLKAERTAKDVITAERLKAGCDERYQLTILAA